MKLSKIWILVISMLIINCKETDSDSKAKETKYTVSIVGAMKNVMWKGELKGVIALDTISNKEGLYGLGPLSALKGELLLMDGESYVSKVTSDTTMVVEKRWDLTAPFFVHATVNDWKAIQLPPKIKTIPDLEKFINEQTLRQSRPFPFKLLGTLSKAQIHIQNLPDNAKVSTPAEAHQGQTNYELTDESVAIIGFFSTEHQGVFTHHDSFLHMHLITEDGQKMGHLDDMTIENITLYIPE